MAEAVPLADQIRCLRREIGLPRTAYPKWVATGRMKQANADREIATMEAVLETLTKLEHSNDA